MDAGVVHQSPGRDTQRRVPPPAAHTETLERVEDDQPGERPTQRPEVEVGSEEDGDDEDGAEVVDDSQRQQERAQRGGQVGADNGEDREREGDVRRHRYGPALEASAADRGGECVEGGRHRHAADGRDNGQGGGGGGAQLADDELAFQLDPGDQEEQSQQAVGRPMADREIEAEGRYAEVEVAYPLVHLAPRAVRPDERDDGGGEQDEPADRLRAQGLGDGLALRPRQQAEDHLPRACLNHGGGPPGQAADGHTSPSDADQTSRHTSVILTRYLHPIGRPGTSPERLSAAKTGRRDLCPPRREVGTGPFESRAVGDGQTVVFTSSWSVSASVSRPASRLRTKARKEFSSRFTTGARR